MKKYNLSAIMTTAWKIFRKYSISFSEALHRAWICAKAVPVNAERIQTAKQEAGITEQKGTVQYTKHGSSEGHRCRR